MRKATLTIWQGKQKKLYHKGTSKNLTCITKKIAGRYQQTDKPVKGKHRKPLITIQVQLNKWTKNSSELLKTVNVWKDYTHLSDIIPTETSQPINCDKPTADKGISSMHPAQTANAVKQILTLTWKSFAASSRFVQLSMRAIIKSLTLGLGYNRDTYCYHFSSSWRLAGS